MASANEPSGSAAVSLSDYPNYGRSMRKALLLLTALLALSGVPLALQSSFELDAGWRKGLALFHIWGGLFFLVMFPLYAWDHVRANRRWLRRIAWVNASGLTQLFTATLLSATGIVLLIYGEAAWRTLRSLHHWLTYVVLFSLAVHFLSPKRSGRPKS